MVGGQAYWPINYGLYIYIVDNAITRIMNIITSMMQILSCEDYQMTISEPVNKRAMCKWVWPDDNRGALCSGFESPTS